VLATVPNILVVHPSVPAKTVAELVQYAKAHPGELNPFVARQRQRGSSRGELLKSVANVDMTHIPFNGIAPP
jgi:tripartite-type tricarboxylate transporter receptor subunit TctC